MNSVFLSPNKYNTSQDHLAHSIPNSSKKLFLNTNLNNLANLPTARTWFSKYLLKFIQTNSSTSRLSKKIKSRKKKKKMKTQITKKTNIGRMTTISKKISKSMRNKMRKVSTTKKASTLKKTKMNMHKIRRITMNK
jgi:hypothetical protein